ncbi:MAG: tRNA (guanosine(37)-N1)-methyltransferase TrmD [Ruminococcaceae bacterium]|nr:tRNA (guanosine(37)-N1)-methyltransferase TrmD [Oscillospiraceae bacterium]
MRFDIMTLFPDLVSYVLGESIIGRAQRSGHIAVNAYNIRDYSKDKHHRVDDSPYGGGMGMLMMAPPIYDCYTAILEQSEPEARRRVIYMSPRGRVLNQEKAKELAQYDQLIILCGHYEGVDARIIEEIVDEEISIGDFVLTGGEIPACILTDAVARLVDGVLSDPLCYENESLSAGLVEYPQYTRPAVFRGRAVPEVLISGHHANIEKWRAAAALAETERLRPDLLKKDN